MPVLLHLKPGQKGTKKLLAEYGDRLVCVRYRYDAEDRKRRKTIELVVAESDWTPKADLPDGECTVGVRIALEELELRSRAKRAGGRWNRATQLWEMPHDRAVAYGLKDRIV